MRLVENVIKSQFADRVRDRVDGARCVCEPPARGRSLDHVVSQWSVQRLSGRKTTLPPQDAAIIDQGNPRHCLRSIKWTEAMEGFVRGLLRSVRAAAMTIADFHFASRLPGCQKIGLR